MQANPVDAAYPERSVSLRIAFRLFQLVAAMRLALNAPRTRVVSEKHRQFLDEWNSHLAPVLCSPDYTGEPLLFREQLEIIANEMLVKPNTTDAVRPVDWSEFVAKYTQGGVIKSLADIVCERIAFICHDTGSMRCRRLLQCRLAILGLYLIGLSKLAGKDFWSSREPGLWSTVRNGFRREARQWLYDPSHLQ